MRFKLHPDSSNSASLLLFSAVRSFNLKRDNMQGHLFFSFIAYPAPPDYQNQVELRTHSDLWHHNLFEAAILNMILRFTFGSMLHVLHAGYIHVDIGECVGVHDARLYTLRVMRYPRLQQYIINI